MKVTISQGTASVDDASVLDKFSVDAADNTIDEVRSSIENAGAGVLEDDHAHIDIAYILTSVGSLADDAEWKKSFDGMIGYAASKGWLTADGKRIVAHLENVRSS